MQPTRAGIAGRALRIVVLASLLSPFATAAQSPHRIAVALQEALTRCGEFKTAGYDFTNYRDAEGVVWPAGRQQDVYLYREVRDDHGTLAVTEWTGHRRDFQPYGSRTRANGYIDRMTARIDDIAPNPQALELTAQGASRGLWGVRLSCRYSGCFHISKQTLFPSNVTDVFIPLAQWQPTGGETQQAVNAWTFEVCAGAGGGTSRDNAMELQQALQRMIR